MFVLEILSLVFDLRYPTDAPANTEVNLLVFPPLGEYNTPETADNAIQGRKMSKEEPCRGAEGRGKNQEGEVRLCESEVESNLSQSARGYTIYM